MKTAVIASSLALGAFCSLSAQTWSALGDGVMGGSDLTTFVYAIEHDAANERMLVGGKFFTAGGLTARNLAEWDLVAQEWRAVGAGTDNAVRSILLDSAGIYYGGDFTTMDGAATSVGICHYDGTSYQRMGDGFFRTGLHAPIASVNVIRRFQGSIYAAGVFDEADGAACMYISRWDGTRWQPVGPGITTAVFSVYDMEEFGGYLYVAGDFDGTSGVVSKNILRWDGSTWSAVGTGTNNTIYALEVMGGYLYAGGSFTTAGGSPASKIARWDGTAWSSIGTLDADVNTLCAFGGNLYVSGLFMNVGGSATERFAIYNPSSGWTAQPSGLSKYASSLGTDGSKLFAGGTFTMAGGSPASHMALYAPFVGVEDAVSHDNGVTVWPQPAQDRVQLSWEGHPAFQVEAMDLQGRVVARQEAQGQGELSIAHLPAGLYMLRLTAPNGDMAHSSLTVR